MPAPYEDRIRLMERRAEFKGPILDLSYRNPFVNRIIEMYCRGIIVTREEAYCQMVVELAKTRDELLDAMMNEQRMKTVLFQPNRERV